MSISEELRRVDALMEGWEYHGLLTSAAQTIEGLAAELEQRAEEMYAAKRRIAQHEETLHWVKVIWAGRQTPEFIPGYVTGRLEEIR